METLSPTVRPSEDHHWGGHGHHIVGPVPVRHGGRIYCWSDTAPATLSWKVFNLDGQCVATLHAGSGAVGLETGSLAPGIYIVTIDAVTANGTHESVQQKIAILP